MLGQGVASVTIFKSYDLQPVAQYIQTHPNHEWAFVRNYHGEVGFLGRVEKSITDLQSDQLQAWFESHPNGMAIIRYKNSEEVQNYTRILSQAYRGKNLGVFVKNP